MGSNIGDRIKKIMEEKGLTQADLVAKTDITSGAISSYITGKYEPKMDKLQLIADALEVHPSYLLGFNEYKSVNPYNDLLELLIKKTKDGTLEWWEENNDLFGILSKTYPNHEKIFKSIFSDYALITYKNKKNNNCVLIINDKDYFEGELVNELYTIIEISLSSKSYIFDLIDKLNKD